MIWINKDMNKYIKNEEKQWSRRFISDNQRWRNRVSNKGKFFVWMWKNDMHKLKKLNQLLKYFSKKNINCYNYHYYNNQQQH